MKDSEWVRPTLSPAFRFEIEIEGINEAEFTSVNGLQAEIELESYREGGENNFEYKFPKRTKYPNLVLKRGMTSSHQLWNWFRACTQGHITRKDCTIKMINYDGVVFSKWTCYKCYPVKWVGPDLTADRSAVGIETLELVHQGFMSDSKQGKK